jgi:hypothetical protein
MKMKRITGWEWLMATAAAALLAAAALVGCAHLQAGADPFVVRVEQGLTTANASFDLVLRLDNADRGFWRTNAPAFHNFCEWLRTPVGFGVTNVPRAIAMQINVDDLKVRYQAERGAGNSNALWLAWKVLEGAGLQAGSWQTIVTTPVPGH